ncbi:MAG: LPS-assembly protein LptD [Desulfatiglandales bacterium]
MPEPFSKAVVLNQGERGVSGIIFWIFFITSMSITAIPIAEGHSNAGGELIPWHITANKIVNLAEEDLYLAEGEVMISKGDQTLWADRVTYNGRSGLVTAEGDVKLSTAGDILRCDRGSFNLKDKTGHISDGTLFLVTNHYYIQGKEISKTGQATYIIKDCRITSCDGENPDWSITGSEVAVTLEGYGTVKHAAFFVRHIPILYFPYIIFPAKRKRQTGFLPPSIGYSRRDGLDFELPFFWAISDQTDATFYERYMSERGLMHGLEFRYITGADSTGAFLYDTISDKKEEKDMYDEDDLKISPYPRENKTRYWFRGRSDQRFPFEIVSRLDADFVSDYDYLREFGEPALGFEHRARLDEESGRPLEEIHSPTRRSALRISRDFDDWSLQALSSYYQRPERPEEDTTAQPLAGLDLTVLPKRILNLPVFFSLDSDYGYIYRDTGQRGQRLALSPSISYSLWPIPYVELEPSIKYFVTYQWLEEFEGHKGKQIKDAYELGLRVSTILERIFDIRKGNIKSIKHKFQPGISYTLRPYPDEEEYRPWFEPVDTLGRLNSISLSLDNYLDARREDERGRLTYSQIANFSLIQDYDLDEATKEKAPGEKREPFGPLRGNLTLTPYPGLDLRATANWDHYKHHMSSGGVALDLTVQRSGNRQDSYIIDYVYSRDTTRNLNYELKINLLYGFAIGASRKRDLIIKHDIENSYWIDYQSQCWGLRLLYEDIDEDKRTMVFFRLLGVGQAGDF